MTSPLTQRLEALRAALRARWLAAGVLRLAAEVAAFLALQFCVDRFLFLPTGARRFVLVVALGLLAWRLFVLVIRPLGKGVRTMDMALAVERRHRGLSGGLASLVEFDARGDQLPPDVSPSLLEMWRRDIEEKGRALSFDAIFDSKLLKRLALVDAAALLLVGGFAVARGTEARIFLERLFGAAVDWPRRTHLSLDVAGAADTAHFRVERDDEGRATRVLVARGGALPIVVRARGEVPDEVRLIVREQGRVGSEEVRMSPREGAPGEFAYRFRNTARAMDLNSEGGDDPGNGPPLQVRVLPPPAVEKLVAVITPPAYTHRAPSREERQEYAVPLGTKLDLEIRTVGDVTEGTLTLHSDPATARPLERDPGEPNLWRASLVAEETGTFNLHLVGKSGFKNLQPLDYPLTVLADRKPALEIARPGVSDLEVTAKGVVPFRLLVDDDYGVTKVELELTRFGAANGRTLALLGEGSARPEATSVAGEPLVLDALLDLRDFRLPKASPEPAPGSAAPLAPEAEAAAADGETIHYVATARDNREDAAGAASPNETASPGRRIDVVAEGEKMRKLADRQLRVKQGVVAAKKSQEERLAGLKALLAGVGDGAIDSKELTAVEIEQGRVCTAARQIARELCDVSQEYVLNRLDGAPTADRVVAFLVGRLEEGKAGPNFDFQPFVRLAAAQAAGEFGQLNQLAVLLVMLDLGLQASETHAQKAREQLLAARLSGRPEERVTLLQGAQDAQQKVIETYALLLQKMEEWEDFQEILDLWRGLVKDQKDINDRSTSPAPAPVKDGGAK
jgi:hypothetical protein